ncbi:hypothetical protein Btru_001204 [Bulinus truncatus]|nr:hypothetical protein Btru_001204 [Bulinus truncatus]
MADKRTYFKGNRQEDNLKDIHNLAAKQKGPVDVESLLAVFSDCNGPDQELRTNENGIITGIFFTKKTVQQKVNYRAWKMFQSSIRKRKKMAVWQCPTCDTNTATGQCIEYKDYEIVEIEKRQDCVQIENYFQFLCLNDSRAVPQLFVGGNYIGGAKQINLLQKSGELKKILKAVHVLENNRDINLIKWN